jgi:beta-barrel assembly-enhancing protease
MKRLLFVAFFVVALAACNDDDKSINVFFVQDDINLGMQLRDTISNDSVNYKVLSPIEYAAAYQYLDSLRDRLLASGEVAYADRFEWEVYILEDSTVNAFCAPGGYIYFYTGIFDVMENEAQLAGVLAHEMAHAARRHTTDNITKSQGFSILASILLGENPSELALLATNIALGLEGLAYSRKQEYEADEYAIRYLAKAGDWEVREIGRFFDILKEMQGPGYTPTFLSTHPSPEDRSEKVQEHWQTYKGTKGQTHDSRYRAFTQLFK